jgi:LDH2 family malate/lactate/ureidoglycolate dehydrogenase
MLGNNPLALAAPRPNGAPIVIDLACSVAARGNIILAQRAGHDIPSGWALDASGAPTQDPREALAGSLLPFGGYKGLMVAAMVEILAGSLSGAPFQAVLNTGGAVRSAPGGVNAFILVLNPDLMIGRAAYDAHVAAWTSHYIAMGGPDGRIPGQRAFEAEQNCSSAGIPLPLSVQQDLAFLSEKYGVPLPQP